MVRLGLSALFLCIFAGMLVVTVYASLDRSIWNVRPALLSDPWFHATLLDAYLGFVTFYVWVAYRETKVVWRIVWFVLIMALGNIAMSVYVLIQLACWDPSQGVAALLCRKPTA